MCVWLCVFERICVCIEELVTDHLVEVDLVYFQCSPVLPGVPTRSQVLLQWLGYLLDQCSRGSCSGFGPPRGRGAAGVPSRAIVDNQPVKTEELQGTNPSTFCQHRETRTEYSVDETPSGLDPLRAILAANWKQF